MNRRQLGLGAAVTAFASAVGQAASAQTRDPSAVAFYDRFNDQLARLPAAIQPDIRAFYELNGWRAVWNAERLARPAVAPAGPSVTVCPQSEYFNSTPWPPTATAPRCAPPPPPWSMPAWWPRPRPSRDGRRPGEIQRTASTARRPSNDALAQNVWSTVRGPGPPTSAIPICPPAMSATAADPRSCWPAFRQGRRSTGMSTRECPVIIQRLVAEGDRPADIAPAPDPAGIVYGPELQTACAASRRVTASSPTVASAGQRARCPPRPGRARQIALNWNAAAG